MESRMLGLLSALCLLSAPAWAGDPTPHCNCPPKLWTAKMNLNQGMKIGNGGPEDVVQYGKGTSYGDLNKGWIVSVIDMVPGGQVTIYQEQGNPFMYLKQATGCMKMKGLFTIPRGPLCLFNQTDMEFKGTEKLGHGDVEVWQARNMSGIVMDQYLSMGSSGQCFWTYQTMAIAVEGYAFSQGVLFTNPQFSVDDPSIFDLPDECKDAVLVTYPASGAQVKMMPLLALVLIFVLHLGF